MANGGTTHRREENEVDLTGGELDAALWDQRQDLLAYAISFAVIGRFWIIHHRLFAFVAPGLAPFLWLALFLEPLGRRFRRSAG